MQKKSSGSEGKWGRGEGKLVLSNYESKRKDRNWLYTYLHEVKHGILVVQDIWQEHLSTCQGVNLMLTIKWTAKKCRKVPKEKEQILS